MTSRPDWGAYFLGIAEAVAERADCTRRKVGAVIVKNNRIVSTGYNGAPAGHFGCLQGGCPRGRHFAVVPPDSGDTLCGGCFKLWPCAGSVLPGSSYDTGPGVCIGLHAEQNAVIYGDYRKMKGSTLYCTDKPCDGCMKMIMGAGIVRILTPELVMGTGPGCGVSISPAQLPED